MNREIISVIKSNRPNDLLEWANYHLAIGFDKITIYNDKSIFSVRDLFSNNKRVFVVDVEEKTSHIPDHSILTMYEKITREIENEENIVAFIDGDEFIYLKDKKLEDVLPESMDVVCLYWKFLSSQSVLMDRSGTMIETFNYSPSWIELAHLKSIINFKKCKNIKWITDCPHLPTVESNVVMRTPDGNVIWQGKGNAMLSPDYYVNQDMYLYHYFYQTLEDWKFKIINRGQFNEYQFLNRPMYNSLDNSMINKKKELGI